MKLIYKAISKDSKVIQGFIDAKSPQEVATYLRGRGYVPIKIETQQEVSLFNFIKFKKKIPHKELVFFTRQLASMLNSGLTLMQSLSILRKQIQNKHMATVVEGIITTIEEGSSFSSAISNHPDVFSPIYIALVKAAEESGLLDRVLERLAENLEKQMKLRSTIRGALTYPAIVVIMMILVMILMMIFVIPNLTKFYDGLNVPLPFTTRMIMQIGNSFIFIWPFLLMLVVGGIYGFRKWYHTDPGKMRVDGLMLRLPVFGHLISETIMAEFTRTFGLLVGTGSLVVDSLEKSASVVGNMPYEVAIRDVAKRVEKGISIGDAMNYGQMFPSIVVETVKIGEQTGKLDESLLRASEYFEREVDQRVKTLTSTLEPFIMIFLAGGVGFLIISIITPIYGLISQIQ